MQNPCMNCSERHPLCHSECEKHLAWKAEREKLKSAVEYERLKMNKIWKRG